MTAAGILIGKIVHDRDADENSIYDEPEAMSTIPSLHQIVDLMVMLGALWFFPG